MKFKTTMNILIGVNLLFLTGCGMSNLGIDASLAGKPGTKVEAGLPIPPTHNRNTNSITRSIEGGFKNSKELRGTYIYADTDGSNIVLSGIVVNEKQKFIASAIANSYVKNALVINRVEIYRPNLAKNQLPAKIEQIKK